MEGILLPICSCVFSTLLIIIYFSKERVNLLENKIYSRMLLLSLIDGILVTIVQGIALDGVSDSELLIISIINKLDFVALMYYTGCMFYYTLLVTIPENKSNKKIAYYVMNAINLIAVILIVFLDVQVIQNGHNYSITGSASIITYLVCGIHLLCSIVTVFIFHKKRDIRHIPIYAIIVIIGILFILFRLNPYLIVISITLTFINYLMYHTIENPDVKMIEELELAKNQAEKANHAKTDFLSSMSHEIRTPLNAIVGFSECVLSSNTLEEAKENSADIINASKTLLEIVNGILDISKIEAGKLEIVNTEYDFNKVTTELIALTKGRLGDKPIELITKIDDTIPRVLYGDASRLKQICVNILTNAVKYTKEGSITFSINSIIKNDVCRLIISVEDTGIGIKQENINKLFNKFERLDLEDNVTIEGTGLGLAITKKLVDLMHGKIVVQSVYGKGSKFTVSIDQRIVKNPTIKVDAPVVKNDDIKVNNKLVLVVDDNKINLKVAERLLGTYGITTECVESGFICIDNLKNGKKYDLILMDDMMPKLSGVETLHKIKEQIPDFNIPTVALTANALTGMREKYLADGFDDYLAKPISKDELNRVINEYLNKE